MYLTPKYYLMSLPYVSYHRLFKYKHHTFKFFFLHRLSPFKVQLTIGDTRFLDIFSPEFEDSFAYVLVPGVPSYIQSVLTNFEITYQK